MSLLNKVFRPGENLLPAETIADDQERHSEFFNSAPCAAVAIASIQPAINQPGSRDVRNLIIGCAELCQNTLNFQARMTGSSFFITLAFSLQPLAIIFVSDSINIF